MKESIFISGVQRELAKERQALRDFVRGDALLGQYFDVFLFNAEYQRLTAATRKTATRDLDDLVGKGLVERVGTTGRGVYYVLARKGDMKGTNGTSPPAHAKGDGNETKGTFGPRDTRSDRKPGAQRGRGGRTGGTAARGGRSRT